MKIKTLLINTIVLYYLLMPLLNLSINFFNHSVRHLFQQKKCYDSNAPSYQETLT